MPLQAVDPRVTSIAAVAAELLMRFHVFTKQARLHGVQDARIAEQVAHR